MKYLIDTNVISEARHPQGRTSVRQALAAIDEADLFISVISIGEIARGIAKLDPGARRQDLEAWLAPTAHGRTLHVADGLIAATAIHHGLCLMTRNVTDFASTGVAIANPWSDPAG